MENLGPWNRLSPWILLGGGPSSETSRKSSWVFSHLQPNTSVSFLPKRKPKLREAD